MHTWKLTWHGKITICKKGKHLQMVDFHCHVSFQWGLKTGCKCRHFSLNVSIIVHCSCTYCMSLYMEACKSCLLIYCMYWTRYNFKKLEIRTPWPPFNSQIITSWCGHRRMISWRCFGEHIGDVRLGIRVWTGSIFGMELVLENFQNERNLLSSNPSQSTPAPLPQSDLDFLRPHRNLSMSTYFEHRANIPDMFDEVLNVYMAQKYSGFWTSCMHIWGQ